MEGSCVGTPWLLLWQLYIVQLVFVTMVKLGLLLLGDSERLLLRCVLCRSGCMVSFLSHWKSLFENPLYRCHASAQFRFYDLTSHSGYYIKIFLTVFREQLYNVTSSDTLEDNLKVFGSFFRLLELWENCTCPWERIFWEYHSYRTESAIYNWCDFCEKYGKGCYRYGLFKKYWTFNLISFLFHFRLINNGTLTLLDRL